MTHNAPAVTGFEVPDQTADKGQKDQVVVALLQPRPSAPWLQCLSLRAGDFKTRHALKDLRVVGSSLSCMGAALNYRAITHAIRDLVEQVSNDTRLALARSAAEPEVEAAPASPAEQWIEGELAARIPGAPDMLKAINRLTGMRFAAMSRVDRKHWTALAFYDAMAFGMAPHQQLDLEVTICGDAMETRQMIAFGKASSDPIYAGSALPSLYGFESYISVPILMPDGEVFGTVCALDAEPRELTAQMLEQMQDYARQVADLLAQQQA